MAIPSQAIRPRGSETATTQWSGTRSLTRTAFLEDADGDYMAAADLEVHSSSDDSLVVVEDGTVELMMSVEGKDSSAPKT